MDSYNSLEISKCLNTGTDRKNAKLGEKKHFTGMYWLIGHNAASLNSYTIFCLNFIFLLSRKTFWIPLIQMRMYTSWTVVPQLSSYSLLSGPKGPETGQCAAGLWWTHQDCWFRDVQGRYGWGESSHNILWNTWLHCTRGTSLYLKSNSLGMSSISMFWDSVIESISMSVLRLLVTSCNVIDM